jgi:hypothetical protein
MSNNSNTRLLEEAAELIDYWEGTQFADQLELAINNNDLDHLWELVRTARFEMLRQEFHPERDEVGDVY